MGYLNNLMLFHVTVPIVRTGLEGPGLTMAQKILYCFTTVGGQYMWARLQSFSAFRRWGDSEQVTSHLPSSNMLPNFSRVVFASCSKTNLTSFFICCRLHWCVDFGFWFNVWKEFIKPPPFSIFSCFFTQGG